MSSLDNPVFDRYAETYDAVLAHGLAVTGETRDFYAKGRVAWLGHCLSKMSVKPTRVMDFGCGTGASTPWLLKLSDSCSVVGIEVSDRSIKAACDTYGSARAQFFLAQDYDPAGDIDLLFCNGVFHHILPKDRAAIIDYLFRALCKDGWFAFWENNPWNPGTRYVMHLMPFDDEAIPLPCIEAVRLLRKGGFEVVRTDFRFYFPRPLRWLRPLERWLLRVPLGGQYQVLCRKP